MKQVFVCQRDYLHPEAPNAHLTCPTGQKIRVVRANFGRTLPDNQICQAGYHHDDDVNCVSPDSLQRAKATCDNKEDCILAPTAGTFRDSCTGTYKYLNVSYVCEGKFLPVYFGSCNSYAVLGLICFLTVRQQVLKYK